MVFKARGAKTYKLRVVAPSGASATLSTGCTIRGDAHDVERVVKQWSGKSPLGRAAERAELLELLVGPKPRPITLREAYEKDLAGELTDWMAQHAKTAADIDLHPFVTAWHRQKVASKKGAGMADQYLRQLRALYPEKEPFALSLWTRKGLKARLEALEIQDGSRNRYKAAASSFCETLLDAELVELNIARTIRGWPENAHREVWYTMEDARRLIPAMDAPFRGHSAILAGFCMEMGALKRLLVGDVLAKAEPVKAHCRGTKRSWRDRWVPLVHEMEWLLPFIEEAIADKHPEALVFQARDWEHLESQHGTADRMQIRAVGEDVQGQHNLHDWRHSHAVWLAQHGYPSSIGQHHLGHKDATMYNKIYANHRPDAHDYALHRERQDARAATKLATTRIRKSGKGS
ncbi:MAG: integrase [Gemmatimonadetes bacterium]|nr:integrase [Gemmatimonadota bacterium]